MAALLITFVQSLYFQQLRGQGAFATGLLFVPMTGIVAALVLATTIASLVVPKVPHE